MTGDWTLSLNLTLQPELTRASAVCFYRRMLLVANKDRLIEREIDWFVRVCFKWWTISSSSGVVAPTYKSYRCSINAGSVSWDMGPGSVRSSRQTVSDFSLRQWFPNAETMMGKIYGSVIFVNKPGSWQRRGPWKISFTFHFLNSLSSLDDMKLAELSNNSLESKDVTFWGSKHILNLLHIYRGSRPPKPMIYSLVLMDSARCSSVSFQ